MRRGESTGSTGHAAARAVAVALVVALAAWGSPAVAQDAEVQPPPDAAVPESPDGEVGDAAPEGSEEDLNGEVPEPELGPEEQEQLEELQEDYEDTTDEELAFFEQYLATQALLDNLNAEIEQLEAQLEHAEAELAEAQQRLAEIEERLARTARRLLMVASDLEDAEQLLRHQAVEAYISGGTNDAAVAAVLQAESSNHAGAVLAYSDVLVSDQRDVIERYQSVRDESRATRDVEAAERAEAEELRDGLATRRAEIEAKRDRQVEARVAVEETARQSEELLGEAAERRAEFEQRIAASASVSDGISGLLAGLQEGQTVPPITTGMFLPPIEGAAVSSSFGPRVHPIYGVARMHNGIDYTSPPGTPIRAAEDGDVVIAESRDGYGLTVVIDHRNGLGTLYGHMSAFAVTLGDEVERGDIVGGVGSTGQSTGPHLHWEVRVSGQPVNPVPYLGPDR